MPKPLRVSDHAVLRYLQRVGGFDIERLRAEIERRVGHSYSYGCNAVMIEGYRYVVKEGSVGPVVVTVLNADLLTTAQQQQEEPK